MALMQSMPLITSQALPRLAHAPSLRAKRLVQDPSKKCSSGHVLTGVSVSILVLFSRKSFPFCTSHQKSGRLSRKKEEAEPNDELSKDEKLKQLGKLKTLSTLSGPSGYERVQTFSAGPIDVDLALGGGWAKGRIVEIYGPESSGKTTLALSAVAEIQKEGGVAVFIDMENALDPGWAERLGVDLVEMQFCQPESAEKAFNIIDDVLKLGAADLIVVDSVSHLTPQEEIDKPYEQNTMGLQARLMSRAMRKISPQARQANCTVMFLNQIRMKIGVVYGNPETRSGGNALRFAATQIVEVRRKEMLKGGKNELGPTALLSRIKVVKNKIAPPFREAELMTDYGCGIMKQRSLILAAEKYGIVTRKGAFYYYGERRLGQGILKAADVLDSESELKCSLEDCVREAATKEPEDVPEAAPESDAEEAAK